MSLPSPSAAPADEAAAPVSLLTFSTLYPNAAQPFHGLFVERRLLRLVATGAARSHVVAPVPWFPSTHPRLEPYATFARVPRAETRDGLTVTHPRHLVIPKIGMGLAPLLLHRGVRGHVRDLARRQRLDLIDAHYFYPDGVAAAMLGRELGLPVVITARGSDINLIAGFPGPRRRILWAVEASAAVIAVSEALKDRLVEIGAPADKIEVLRNGVDLTLFRPRERAAEPRPRRFALLIVGNLVPNKGQHIAIEAVASMPDVALTVVGDGPERDRLVRLADGLGVTERVEFAGPLAASALVERYNEADATLLLSAREGMPNVVLESLACGTPVLATGVGGVPEIVRGPAAGIVLRDRSAASVVEAVRRLRADPPERRAVRAFAERFGWDDTIAAQLELYRAVARRAARARVP